LRHGRGSAALALPLLLVLAACGGGERRDEASGPPSPPPAQTRPAPTSPREPANPFHEETRAHLAAGDLEAGELALTMALALDPADDFALTVLGALALHRGEPNEAAHHFVDALQTRSKDCMLALALAMARRRVDVAAGSSQVLRDILAYHGCPSAAYGVAVERLARQADPAVAGGLLPGGGPTAAGPSTARIVTLDPDRPGFSALADAANTAFGGRLTVLGDQFADISDRARVEGQWVADDLALLYVRVAPGLPYIPDQDTLNSRVNLLLQAWEMGVARAADRPAWQVLGWAEFEDVRGRFRIESPQRWYANMFQGPGGALYTFAPVEIEEPGAEAVRTGAVPAFDLKITERGEGDPPPWDDKAVYALIARISGFFAGADHFTDPWVEFLEEQGEAPPGVLIKRTCVVGDEVYRIGAAEIAGPRYLYRFTFAGPAEGFDVLEADFWRFVQSLRPTGPSQARQ